MSTPNPSHVVSRALVPINNQIRSRAPEQRLPSSVPVTFFNTTDTTINIRWWASDKTYKDYGDLAPKRYTPVATYYGHRWAFYDTFDGEILSTHLSTPDEEEIYFAAKPPPNYREGQECPPQYVLIRRQIQSLSYLSLKFVAKRRNLAELQLPTKVKEALIEYFQRKAAFVQQYQRDVVIRQTRPIQPLVRIPR